MSGPITPERLAAATEIVALPGWRWTRGLHSVRGLVVRVDPDGVPVVRTLQDEQILETRWDDQMVQRNGALLPDVDDELLPGWLLRLLRLGLAESVSTVATWDYASEFTWTITPTTEHAWSRVKGATIYRATQRVHIPDGPLGAGPSELHALVAALRRVG